MAKLHVGKARDTPSRCAGPLHGGIVGIIALPRVPPAAAIVFRPAAPTEDAAGLAPRPPVCFLVAPRPLFV